MAADTASLLGRLLLEPHPAACACEKCLYWESETLKALAVIDARIAWADALSRLDDKRKKKGEL